MTSKRERIPPNGDTRFIRRDARGRFAESDDAGRSVAQDRHTQAQHEVKPGQGDRGDQRKR